MKLGVIVGRKIRQFREKSGQTQLQFAMDTYMSPSYISRFERGLVVNPTQATLEHIAASIGTTLEELIHDDEMGPLQLTVGDFAGNEAAYQEFLSFKQRFDRQPEWRQKEIRAVVEALLGADEHN